MTMEMHIKPMQNAWSREKLQNYRKALKRWWSVGMLVLFTRMLQSEFINTSQIQYSIYQLTHLAETAWLILLRCLAFAFFSDAVVRQPDYGSHVSKSCSALSSYKVPYFLMSTAVQLSWSVHVEQHLPFSFQGMPRTCRSISSVHRLQSDGPDNNLTKSRRLLLFVAV